MASEYQYFHKFAPFFALFYLIGVGRAVFLPVFAGGGVIVSLKATGKIIGVCKAAGRCNCRHALLAVFEYPVNGHDLGEEVRLGEGKVDFPALFRKLKELVDTGVYGKVLSLPAAGEDAGVINPPKTDAYADEIRYFIDHFRAGIASDRIKPEELETVIDIIDHL